MASDMPGQAGNFPDADLGEWVRTSLISNGNTGPGLASRFTISAPEVLVADYNIFLRDVE